MNLIDRISLRGALLADAAFSGAAALLLIAGAGALDSVLGLPAVFLRTVGLILIPFVAGVAYLLSRDDIPRGGAWAVAVVNVLWVIDSIALLVAGVFEPTVLGQTFVVVQAIAVGVFAEMQIIALRKTAHLATA